MMKHRPNMVFIDLIFNDFDISSRKMCFEVLFSLIVDFSACSAIFSTFERHLPQVHSLINEHISQSFLYSVMSSHFETDSENRLGFGKYLDSLADTMWEDAVDLIKYAGKRGAGVAPLLDDEKTGLRLSDVIKIIRIFLWLIFSYLFINFLMSLA